MTVAVFIAGGGLVGIRLKTLLLVAQPTQQFKQRVDVGVTQATGRLVNNVKRAARIRLKQLQLDVTYASR